MTADRTPCRGESGRANIKYNDDLSKRAWARESRSDESASGPDGRLGHDVTCFDNGHCNGERGVVPSFTPRSETEYNIASRSITTESKQVANAMY